MRSLRSSFALTFSLLAPGIAAPTFAQPATPPARQPVRITMEALHQAGGVPPGWQLSPGEGVAQRGRVVFVDLGCHACHTIRGAALPEMTPGPGRAGPDLTGMGAHHPAGYFVESILDPNAVLVEGPGYIDDDGFSRMPTYPGMSLQQLGDVVAYLTSLTEPGGEHEEVPLPSAATEPAAKQVPAPPEGAATAFLAQTYDVKEGELEKFETWFREQGAMRLVGIGGLVSIETFVDRTRPGPSITTVFGFQDEAALRLFSTHGALREAKLAFDEFLGLHGHTAFASPPVYHAPSLSAAGAPSPPDCALPCQGCHSESFASCKARFHRFDPSAPSPGWERAGVRGIE